jgi:hypothetical protein
MVSDKLGFTVNYLSVLKQSPLSCNSGGGFSCSAPRYNAKIREIRSELQAKANG